MLQSINKYYHNNAFDTIKQNTNEIFFMYNTFMENSLSVIIPTLQKNLTVLKKLVQILLDDDIVSEILILNNAIKKLKFNEKSDKIKIITPKENLYVNKSWNLGIKEIKNDLFLIINDDILPVQNFCSKIVNSGIFKRQNTGLVGINPNFIMQYSRETVSDIDIPPDTNNFFFLHLPRYKHVSDWGSAFLGLKSNFYEIPEDLKIIFGDNFLLFKNILNKKMNYQITGLPFNHIHSLSSADEEFSSIIKSDIECSAKYLPK